MKLNIEAIKPSAPSAADALTAQAAQYIGELMQLQGIALIKFELPAKQHTPADITLEFFQGSPEPLQQVARSTSYYMAGLMLEFNLTKLSYTYTQDDVRTLKDLWDKASSGIASSKLLTPPDVTPDMERIDIDL